MSLGRSTTIGGLSCIEETHLTRDSIAALPMPLVSRNPELIGSGLNSDWPQSRLNLLQVESSVFDLRFPIILSLRDWHLLILSDSGSRGWATAIQWSSDSTGY